MLSLRRALKTTGIIFGGLMVMFGILFTVSYMINPIGFHQALESDRDDGYTISDYDQAYAKWSECAKHNSIQYCGNPPPSPFSGSTPDCINDNNQFGCNPYYQETRSILKSP